MRRLVAVALLCVGWLLGLTTVPAPASAHAELVSATPEAGARLDTAPRQATLRFTESVTLVDGGLRLLDDTGQSLRIGEPRRDGVAVVVPLPRDLGDGAYLLVWRVVSADTHPVHGTLPFAVGDADPPVVSDVGGGEAARLLLALVRWVGFVGVVLVVGTLAFVLLCWPGGVRERRVRGYLGYGGAAVAAGALVSLPLQAAYASGRSLRAALDPAGALPILQSTFGQAAAARVGLLAVLGVVLRTVLVAPERRSPLGRAVAVLVAVGVLGTFAMSGHAMGASQRPLALISDTVHLAAMACWLGGLVVLGTGPLLHGPASELRETLPRWSRTAMGCVGLLVLTGSYQAWREVGTLPALTGTPYGRLLLLKLAGFVALVALGNLGRLWVQRGAAVVAPASVGAMSVEARADVSRLRRSVVAEVGIGLVVLGLTAALVATSPGRTAIRAEQAPAVASTTLPGGVRVAVTADPPVAGSAIVELRLESPGGPLDPLEVRAVAALPERDVAGLSLPLHHVGPGRYAAHGTTLPFPGRWQVTVTVRTTDVVAGVGTTTVILR